MTKCVILLGGPNKGTRFRPLSMDTPKPLFPVAGVPMIFHHIEAASKVEDMKEILLIGSYQQNEVLNRFINETQNLFKIPIRYLQEYTALGTAGGLYQFRDQITRGNCQRFFVMNCDVCGDFPLNEMLEFQDKLSGEARHVVLGTEATRQQSLNYGCIVDNNDTHEVRHYVEKPETFISATINCGVYLFTNHVFSRLKEVFSQRQDESNYDWRPVNKEVLGIEHDVLTPLAGSGCLFVYQTNRFWSQIKNAGAAIYANRNYLLMYRKSKPDLLAQTGKKDAPNIVGDVYIHPTAKVHPTATLGPNVTIGKGVVVGEGVRIRESILLDGATVQEHSCVMHTVMGWRSSVGAWSRVEGTPNDPNPNKPYAKLDIQALFNNDGKLNPSITVIGTEVQIPSEVMVLNSIVLPHKELQQGCKNQIIL